jgi:hypothetical protein
VQTREALGELVGVASEGLLARSIRVGLGVGQQLMEDEIDECGRPEGQAQPGLTAKRTVTSAGR